MSGNIWALFDSLLHTPANTLATVRQHSGSVYTVELLDGQMVEVMSTGVFELDSRVFINQGVIVGLAPNLTFFEVEV